VVSRTVPGAQGSALLIRIPHAGARAEHVYVFPQAAGDFAQWQPPMT